MRRMKHYFLCGFTLPVFALLSACNGAGLFSNSANPQLDRLESSLAQCNSSQTENQQQLHTQLKQQQALLQRQTQTLDEMSGMLTLALENNVNIAPITESVVVAPACALADKQLTKLLVGRHEQVWLEDVQLFLPARIDTGAETASLDAHNIELFERNGKRWVRFEILHPDSGDAVLLEKRLKRTVLIVQANSSEPERRPVIKLGIQLGNIKQSAEFTLSNRSHLDYQMLIGRNILKDVMIVDVSKINVASREADTL